MQKQEAMRRGRGHSGGGGGCSKQGSTGWGVTMGTSVPQKHPNSMPRSQLRPASRAEPGAVQPKQQSTFLFSLVRGCSQQGPRSLATHLREGAHAGRPSWGIMFTTLCSLHL